MSTITDSDPRTPEAARLDFFVGDWQNTGTIYPGPFGPGGDSTGATTYRWEMGGVWLMYDSRLTLPGMGEYRVQGGVTYDRRAGQYRAFAFNSLGVLLVYDGHWEGADRLVFDLVHPQPQGGSRVVYIKNPDGSIQMNSETSTDGTNYKPYFETTLTPTG